MHSICGVHQEFSKSISMHLHTVDHLLCMLFEGPKKYVAFRLSHQKKKRKKRIKKKDKFLASGQTQTMERGQLAQPDALQAVPDSCSAVLKGLCAHVWLYMWLYMETPG